eukprot:scaffold1.g5176.t1
MLKTGPLPRAVKASGLVFVSGQVGLVPGTKNFAAADVEGQTEQVMKNLGAILQAAGSDWSKVVKTTILLSTMDDFAKVNAIYGSYFEGIDFPPARATFAVAGRLASSGSPRAIAAAANAVQQQLWMGAGANSAAPPATVADGAARGLCAAAATGCGASADVLGKVEDRELVKTLAFVDGQWVGADSGATLQVLNPATAEPIATVPQCGGAETRAAISAAAASFDCWAGWPGKERAKLLRKWYDLVLAAREDIAVLMTLESGKPLAESKAEFDNGWVQGGADGAFARGRHSSSEARMLAAGRSGAEKRDSSLPRSVASIEWFAEEAKRTCGDVMEAPDRQRRFLVLKQPVGVVAAITPWNFPFSMITRKVSPALAAGCTVVLKPSEETPLTALALAELADRAGIPKGVINIVVGNAKAIGEAMLQSDQVRKIGFTGSTAVGKLLMAGAAQTVKRVSLELGGNAPFVIFADADIKRAATAVVASSHRNSGQTCICANRVFVQASPDAIYDEFVEELTRRVAALRVGSGMEAGITQGPLITAAAVARVEDKVQDALALGATGKHAARERLLWRDALYATREMRLFREEVFGPVTPCFKFSTEDEAVALANDTEYGLAAYFYTNDLSRAWTVAERLQYGMVGINEVAITSEVVPFGGIKQSGMGREQSKYGLAEFQDLKTLCIGLRPSPGPQTP